jgi:hypothetical protein
MRRCRCWIKRAGSRDQRGSRDRLAHRQQRGDYKRLGTAPPHRHAQLHCADVRRRPDGVSHLLEAPTTRSPRHAGGNDRRCSAYAFDFRRVFSPSPSDRGACRADIRGSAAKVASRRHYRIDVRPRHDFTSSTSAASAGDRDDSSKKASVIPASYRGPLYRLL